MLISCGIRVRSKISYYQLSHKQIYLPQITKRSIMEYLVRVLSVASLPNSKRGATQDKELGKMKTESRDFIKSGSYPDNVVKVMITA